MQDKEFHQIPYSKIFHYTTIQKLCEFEEPSIPGQKINENKEILI